MFQIKICGVTTADDARMAIDSGADAIGLNFYPKSKRYLPPEEAAEVSQTIGDSAAWVGVFVNETAQRVREIAELSRLDFVQLHGDEPPGFVAELAGLKLIRARRMEQRGVAAVAEDLAACQAASRLPNAVLVDAAAPGQFGGTGHTVTWEDLVDYHERLGLTPLLLAGGLTPDNVAEAIRIVRPHGVDVASGVESSPGVKDPAKVQDFVAAAKEALANLKRQQ